MNHPISITYTSSDFLKLLLDNTKEIFLVIDASLNIVLFNKEANKAALHLLRKELKEGESILNYADPARLEKMKAMYKDVLLGNPMKYKYPLNDEKIFSLDLLPVYDSGTVKFISLTCVDITSEEQALQQLSRDQALLQRAERIAGLGSWEWDIPTDKVVWSDELYRMLGLEPGEAKASKEFGFTFIHPDDISLAEHTLVHSFRTGDPYNIELRLIAKDGSLRYVFCQGIVVRDEKGRNEKFIGTFHDITSKRLLEKSIYNQEQRFQALIENSADMVLQVNEQRLITYVSPAIVSMMNYSVEEVVGKRLSLLAYPEDLVWMIGEFEEIIKTPGKSKFLQYRVVKKDGTPMWVEGTTTNLFHVPGVNSIVINQRDITRRKEAERLLNELNETLESRAVELSSSNIELERFAYVASHDLQEPLRMVTSFLQLLKKKYDGALDEKAQQYIHYAVDGSERMKRLINDMLDYSRTGNKHGTRARLNMNDILKNISIVFKEQLDETGGKIVTRELPEIVAEKTQMIQLFQNLAGNAIKYRSAAAPMVTVGATENENEWLFSIEDNGMGIPAKFSEEIFNIFQRLHGKNEYEGTGIGLAICKKIVEAHGGRIWVVPAEKQGSIFYFTIKKQLEAVD